MLSDSTLAEADILDELDKKERVDSLKEKKNYTLYISVNMR